MNGHIASRAGCQFHSGEPVYISTAEGGACSGSVIAVNNTKTCFKCWKPNHKLYTFACEEATAEKCFSSARQHCLCGGLPSGDKREVMSSGPDWAWLALVNVFHNWFAKHFRGMEWSSVAQVARTAEGEDVQFWQVCCRWTAEMNRWDLWMHWIYLFCVRLNCVMLTCHLYYQLFLIFSTCKNHSQQLEHVTEGASYCTN